MSPHSAARRSVPLPETVAGLSSQVDVLVAGGGINGVGIARDLAGREVLLRGALRRVAGLAHR